MAVTIPIGLMNEKSDKLHVKLGEGKRSMKLAYRQHAVELTFTITVWKSQGAGRHAPKHPDAAGGVDGCAKVVLWTHVRGVLACSERASLPMLPPSWGDEMAQGRTGGWLLAAETISAGQTTRPPEIIVDITSEEIRGNTSLSTDLVTFLYEKLSCAAEILIWSDAVDFLTKSLGMPYSVVTAQ